MIWKFVWLVAATVCLVAAISFAIGADDWGRGAWYLAISYSFLCTLRHEEK
jgi:hypothetical protein